MKPLYKIFIVITFIIAVFFLATFINAIIPRYEIIAYIAEEVYDFKPGESDKYVWERVWQRENVIYYHCETIEIETQFCDLDKDLTYEQVREMSSVEWCADWDDEDISNKTYGRLAPETIEADICYIKEKIRK